MSDVATTVPLLLAALEHEDGGISVAAVLGPYDRIEAVSPRFADVAGRWFPGTTEAGLPDALRALIVEQRESDRVALSTVERADGSALEIRLLRRLNGATFDVVVLRERAADPGPAPERSRNASSRCSSCSRPVSQTARSRALSR